jgi:hypothetical protein
VGTTTPDLRPAPAIIYQNRHGIDVVTVATEAPLSFSSVIVKVDTDLDIGRPGATVIFEGRKIGMLETEQYGSKMLHIGGAEQLTADQSGFAAARAVTDIVNRKVVKLRIKDGAQIEAQIGQAPIINGSAAGAMKVGCGSATIGLFAKNLLEAADDVIVVDSQITGQLSRHAAGLAAGAKPTGIELIFRESTPGRYFCESGPGIGGTDIIYPLDIIKRVDTKIAKIGSTVLITETTGQVGYMFTVKAGGLLIPMELTKKAALALKEIHDCCESSLVSAVYTGGAGGSARAGVCRHPPKLTKAIHQNKAVLTVAGAPAFVLPGGGINFFVDVGQIKPGSFYWTPTPATICPLEYTMRLEDYQEIGGHIEVMKPFTPQKYK